MIRLMAIPAPVVPLHTGHMVPAGEPAAIDLLLVPAQLGRRDMRLAKFEL